MIACRQRPKNWNPQLPCHTHEVEALRVNREVEWRDHDREHEDVEDARHEVEWQPERSEPELGRPEAVRRHGESEEADEGVRCDGGDPAGRDEGRERHLTWEDGAEDERAEDEHDRHSVPGLAVG